MNVEIGFWSRDPEGKKVKINVSIFGGNLEWTCQRGRFQSWEPYPNPTDEEWEIALREAEQRVPRRIISPKYVELIRNRGKK